MRPRGSYGEVAMALKSAAEQGPGCVRELAERAQVAYGAARYTASRLVDRGELMVIDDARPAVLALPPAGDALAARLQELQQRFWNGEGHAGGPLTDFGAL